MAHHGRHRLAGHRVPLSVGVTDPPVIALTRLTLALAYRERLVWAGLVLALACAMKTTAWAVIPVLGVMAWVRYTPRAAARFAAAAIGLTAVLAAAGAPAALASPSAVNAVKQNLIEYPLGSTKYKTPAPEPAPWPPDRRARPVATRRRWR